MAAILQEPKQSPPWAGPAFSLVPADRAPAEQPAEYPIENADNPNLFPPVCLRSHWDPEQIIRRTLPNQKVSLPLDPRPWTKVCLDYVTSAPFEDAPRPSDSVVFPSGGEFYPPTRYREAVDNENELRRLDRPLGTCERKQFQPARSGDMYMPNSTVPERKHVNSRFVQELAFPMALMRSAPYECRQKEDLAAMSRSSKLFNNATKQERYSVSRPDLVERLS